MPDVKFRIIIEHANAKSAVAEVDASVSQAKQNAETPAKMTINAQAALGTLRDVMLNLSSLKSVLDGVTNQINGFLDAQLKQRQAVTLVDSAFGDQSKAIQKLASDIQGLTNVSDEALLPLMAKMRRTFKLTAEEIAVLSPLLVDFTEANAATGMTVATAFDLVGKALNGHAASLEEYGVKLDETRMAQEGASYLAQVLADDYRGVSVALADLRLQNANTWGDIKEQIGEVVEYLSHPLLEAIKDIFEWFNNLSPVVRGLVAGIAMAIPIIGTLTTAITTLTSVVIALKAAINPVVGVISLLAGAATAAGFAFASQKIAAKQAENGLSDYRRQAEDTTAGTEELAAALERLNTELVDNVAIYAATKEEIAEMSYDELIEEAEKLDRLLAAASGKFDTATTVDEILQANNAILTLEARKAAIVERGQDAAREKRQEFHAQISDLDVEAALEGVRLAQWRVDKAQEEFDTLDKLTAANAEQYLAAKKKLIQAQQQLTAAEKAEADKRAQETEKETQREKENADIRAEFWQKQQELQGNTYQAQLDAIDRYYEESHDKLRTAGLTEEQIVAQTELAKQKVRDAANRQLQQGMSSMFGNLAKTAEAFGRDGFAIWKTMSIAQATVDTFASATAAYKAMVGIPVVGPGLAVAAAAAAVGAGLANVAQISKVKYNKAATGGLLTGPDHAHGGLIVEGEGGEYFTNKDRVSALGKRFFDFVNFGPLRQVREFLASASVPAVSIPVPAVSGAYGAGGAVSGGMSLDILARLVNEVVGLREDVRNARPVINVDPLDPARVSELADEGKLIRSEL